MTKTVSQKLRRDVAKGKVPMQTKPKRKQKLQRDLVREVMKVKRETAQANRAAKPVKKKNSGAPRKSSGIGRFIGSGLGMLTGLIPGIGPSIAATASSIGGALGDGFENLVFRGSGDYIVENNSMISPDGTVRITASDGWFHLEEVTEYLGEVYTGSDPAAFNVTTFSFNPGLARTCPWTSIVSKAFTQWKPLGAIIELRSMLSSTSVKEENPEIGQWGIAPYYNPTVPQPYTDFAQMQQADGSKFMRADSTFLVGLECKPKDRVIPDGLQLRWGAQPPNTDLNIYDLCEFSIATIGIGGEGIIDVGSAYLHHKTAFAKKSIVHAERSIPTDLFNITAPESGDQFKAATAVRDPNSNLGGTLRLGSPVGYYDFPNKPPPGDYLFTYVTTGLSPALASDITVGPKVVDVSPGCTVIEDWNKLAGQPNMPVTAGEYMGGTNWTAGYDPTGQTVTQMWQIRIRVAGGVQSAWARFTDTQAVRPWEATYASLSVSPINQNVGYYVPPAEELDSVVHLEKSLPLLLSSLDDVYTRKGVASTVTHLKSWLRAKHLPTRDADLLAACQTQDQRDKLQSFNFGRKLKPDFDRRIDLIEEALLRAGNREPRPEQPERLVVEKRNRRSQQLIELEKQLKQLREEEAFVVDAYATATTAKTPMEYSSTPVKKVVIDQRFVDKLDEED